MPSLRTLLRRLTPRQAAPAPFEYFHDAAGVLHRRAPDGTVEYHRRGHWHPGVYPARSTSEAKVPGPS